MSVQISDEIIKDEKSIIEDLIVAAHNNAKEKLKSKTTKKFQKLLVDLEYQVLSGRTIHNK